MKIYNFHIVDSVASTVNDETRKEILGAKSILIQVFSGENATKTQQILQDLNRFFPTAHIIASSTDGEIYEERVLTHSIVVSIATFENTIIKSAYCDTEESFVAGETLAKEVTTSDTKLIISFANGILCNGDEFLHGLSAGNKNMMIAGGLSGDNAKFEKCYIGLNDSLYERGAVAVSLNSKTLEVTNLYHFGWREIGLSHTVTKAKANRVYTIDDIPVIDFYVKYLGKAVVKMLPSIGIKFPLLLTSSDGFQMARAVTMLNEDGSLSFAGNIQEGEIVHFAIGDAKHILFQSLQKVYAMNAEAFFIYSCMARRRLLPDDIQSEISPFASVAPTSGFFTYGEFYTEKKSLLLNQTLTAIAISESKSVGNRDTVVKQNIPSVNPTVDALMHLLNQTSKELKEKEQEVAAKVNTLQAVQEMSKLSNWELDLQTMKITWSESSYELYGRDPLLGPPTYKEFLDMVLEEDRKELVVVQEELYDGEVHSIEIHAKRSDGKVLVLLEIGQLIFGNDGKPLKVVGVTLDLTELRERDSLLVQQSKAAQMGEMINMIAHQWRQPLNAISAESIKFAMQNEMGILTKEEVAKSAKFIEDMTQKMSQTINDFLSFSTPENKKEYICLKEVLADILNIIGKQLENHNIKLNISIQIEHKIFTYKKELEHILINLISNARDALDQQEGKDKEINIQAYEKSNFYIIKVSDTGGGISADILHRVFDPYFTTKGPNGGTGLGLYMTKKLLKEHLNGDIFVRNKGRGVEFSIIMEIKNKGQSNEKPCL